MLSTAEYQAYASDIDNLGQFYDQQIADATQDQQNQAAQQPNNPQPKQQAINIAQSFTKPYQRDLQKVLNQGLVNVAENAIAHYQQRVGSSTQLPNDLAAQIVNAQYKDRYYGGTLNQRIVLLRLRLNRAITQSAQVGLSAIAQVHSNPIPFGAQSNISKRLFQGTAIKVEQDVAKKVATEADYPLIRWTLSKSHRVTCACDDIANNVDKEVEAYLSENNIDIDATGLFFLEDLPVPPHPNCQCEWSLVKADHELVPSQSRRPIHLLRKLFSKLLRS